MSTIRSVSMKLVNTRKLLASHKWDIERPIYITYDLFYSEAFRSLSKVGMYMFFRFLQKRTLPKQEKGHRKKRSYEYDDFINDNLVFTYAEAAAFGISEAAFNRGRKELLSKGFLEQTYQGGTLGNKKDYSRYKYIEEWKWYGTSGSFKPSPIPKGIHLESRKCGFDKVNAKRKAKKERKTRLSKLTVVPQSKTTVVPQSKSQTAGCDNDSGEQVPGSLIQ